MSKFLLIHTTLKPGNAANPAASQTDNHTSLQMDCFLIINLIPALRNSLLLKSISQKEMLCGKDI
ncbi:hypothetical protein [Undibacterium pigrum]|uniref:hypothetical protein n=1 Tax=Undibacterium pigrum TaxID=401470 RepID=UPI000D76E34A|nr:hypothetical protein [Undibacterium pigrum]